MTALDWILLVLWAGIAASGFWKGAVRLVFGLGGFAAGVWMSTQFSGELADRLSGSIQPHWLAALCAWILPILVATLLFTLAGWGIERTLKALHLSWANRLLGAGLAGIAGALLLSMLIVFSLGLSPEWRDICSRSLFFPYLARLADFFFASST